MQTGAGGEFQCNNVIGCVTGNVGNVLGASPDPRIRSMDLTIQIQIQPRSFLRRLFGGALKKLDLCKKLPGSSVLKVPQSVRIRDF